MTITQQTGDRTIDFACAMADTARTIALQYFRTSLSHENKQDGSPVTIADRTIEAKLRDMIKEQFPNDGILGEEEESVGLDSDNIWIVDPIDGTKSFMTGMPTFGALIARVEKGKPSLGIIEVPAMKERWVGCSDGPTMLNGTVCKASSCKKLSDAAVYATSPDIFTKEEASKFNELTKVADMRRFGGDCYAYALLASGHVDGVVESDLKPFDYMSLVAVIEGAGGVITDWQGAPLSINSNGRVVAAATSELHSEMLAYLKG